MSELTERIEKLDWRALRRELHDHGYAVAGEVLDTRQCQDLITLFDEHDCYRSVIDMRRHRFGSGIYKYFDRPLPATVQELRVALYGPLAETANDWPGRIAGADRYPASLEAFLDRCHERGQTRPTPLIFRYERGDFNRLHEDIYGPVGFPFQALAVLSRRERDYSGGEFLLVTQQPRTQSIGEVVDVEQGELLIFPNQYRPLRGKRGETRATVRHGVSRVRSGLRHALGIIFHDAE